MEARKNRLFNSNIASPGPRLVKRSSRIKIQSAANSCWRLSNRYDKMRRCCARNLTVTTVQIASPDHLLPPARLEQWLRDQRRGQPADELFAAMNRMAAIVIRALMCLLIFFLAGCVPVSIQDLPGKYRINFDFGQEELDLSANGKYHQIITVYGEHGKNESVTHSGTWWPAPPLKGVGGHLQHYDQVLLDNPIMICDEFGDFNKNYRIPFDGAWGLITERWLGGKLKLYLNEDIDLRFDKVSQEPA